LVGFEDGLKPLIYYIDDLTWFKQEVIRESVDIPYVFHAGETLTDGGAADQVSSPFIFYNLRNLADVG
jgi:adenosine deaminase CECR1